MPWADAIRRVPEAELRREAKAPGTLGDWKVQGVPADVLLPLLLATLDARSEPAPGPVITKPWLVPEWQATHAFTSLVEALGKRGREATLGAPVVTRTLLRSPP